MSAINNERRLLAEDADWNAETWSFRPAALDDLAQTVEAVGRSLRTPFTFEAIWVSDEVKGTVEVDLPELVALARRGKLGTHTRYIVSTFVAA